MLFSSKNEKKQLSTIAANRGLNVTQKHVSHNTQTDTQKGQAKPMGIIIAAGACAATFSATVLGIIQIIRRVKWKQKLVLIPTITYAIIAVFLWIVAMTL